MKLLLCFVVIGMLLGLVGNVKWNGKKTNNIFIKLFVGLLCGINLAIIFGLPILGLMSLV